MAEKDTVVYPYIPNTAPANKEALKKAIGIEDDMELYKDIPEALRYKERLHVPEAMGDEYTVQRFVKSILAKNISTEDYTSFLGAGCDKHYTPAVCDEMISRGEFLTAYFGATTNDLGKWQAIWEYQAQMSELLDVDFIGFPQYDGSWALAHAFRMCKRITGRKKILVPASMSPENYRVAKNYLDGVTETYAELEKVAFDAETGLMDLDDLKAKLGDDVAAVLVENPTFLGNIETQAKEIGELAKAAGADFIVYTLPISLGVMEAPANYGANITVGDLHSLGCHVAAGGQMGGFVGLPADPKYLSQYKDLAVSVSPTIEDGEYSFVLFNFEEGSYGLRENANEFTGTASNLWAIHTAVYLTIMGPQGMKEVGQTTMKRAQYAAEKLGAIPKVKLPFNAPFFEEFVVNFDESGLSVADINAKLRDYKILGGFDLSRDFPELGQSALYCFTEVTTQEDIDALAAALKEILA